MIRVAGAKRSDVAMVLDLQLTRFCKSINISVPLTDYQKTEVVLTMMERYPHETLNDFLLMFRNARLGLYGPIYNRIDITVISEYMTRYLDGKAYEREQMEKQLESEIMADFKFIEKTEFKNADEFEEWRAKWFAEKSKWYSDKLVLHDKLQQIDKKYEIIKRRGSLIAMTGDDGKDEAGYQKFKSAYLEKARAENNETKTETKDDTRTGGSMVGDGNIGPIEIVPIFIGNGSDDIEQIQRTGPEHHQQGDGVQSQSEALY
jgi:hypothetical protein